MYVTISRARCPPQRDPLCIALGPRILALVTNTEGCWREGNAATEPRWWATMAPASTRLRHFHEQLRGGCPAATAASTVPQVVVIFSGKRKVRRAALLFLSQSEI